LIGALSQIIQLQRAGRSAEAWSAWQEIAAANPEHAEVLHIGAVLARERRALGEARRLADAAVERSPGTADYHNTRASVLSELPNAEARAAFTAATAAHPQIAAYWNGLGAATLRGGDPARAATAFERAVRRAPDNADFRGRLGFVLFQLHRHTEAVEHYRAAIRGVPHSAPLHYNLGLALLALSELDPAIAAFSRAVELDPGLDAAHAQLANARLRAGQGADTLRSLIERTRARPDDLVAHRQLALALLSEGYLDEARRLLTLLMKQAPDDTILGGLAECAERSGDLPTALELLAERVQAPEPPPALLAVYGRVCQRLGETDKAIARLRAALPHIPPGYGRSQALFILGDCLDATEDHAAAFDAYHEANELRRGSYDLEDYLARVDELRRLHTAERIAARPHRGDPSERPVLIVGMPRSGSSLTEQIIAAHPQAAGAGELGEIPSLVGWLRKPLTDAITIDDVLRSLSPQQVARLSGWYLDQLNRRAGAEALRITDKQLFNYLHLGEIATVLPGARIIHCLRDPVDTCWSTYTRSFNSGQSYATDLARLGRMYRGYHAAMEHWRAHLPLPLLDVRYEDTVADPEAAARRIIAFCGLPWHDDCLRFHHSGRAVKTASYAQVTRPIYRSSVDRSRPYRRLLGPLLEQLGALAE